MTHIYKAATAASIYRGQLRDLIDNPDHIVTVRGRPTRELINVVTEIEYPRARCNIVPGRKLNPWLALSESLWLLAGRNDLAALTPYNKNICQFSDDGETLYGAYGDRISDQLEDLIGRLLADPNDRRAVLQIWRKSDLTKDTKDPPCNDLVMFKVRENRLHMTVVCRSNDLHWGLYAVNLFQFGILQEYVACYLGADVGTQTHLSQSLHIYTDEIGQKITNNMMAKIFEPLEVFPKDPPLFPVWFSTAVSHEEFAIMCSSVLDGNFGMALPEIPFFEFAEDFLRSYSEPDVEIRHAELFPGWMAMAKEFRG